MAVASLTSAVEKCVETKAPRKDMQIEIMDGTLPDLFMSALHQDRLRVTLLHSGSSIQSQTQLQEIPLANTW